MNQHLEIEHRVHVRLAFRIIALRLVFIGLLVAAALAFAADAKAGTYDVYACDPNHAGGLSPSFAAVADPGLTTYTDCPSGEGIVARSVWDNGQSNLFQGAQQIFDAPPGTTVDSIHGFIRIQRPSCEWSVGIVASPGDMSTNLLYGLQSTESCTTSGIDWMWMDLPVGTSRVRLQSVCGALACPRGQGPSGFGVASTQLRGARITIRDDSPPSVADARGGLWTAAWIGGKQSIAFGAADASGIQSAAALVDGIPIGVSSKTCDFLQRSPCPGEGMNDTVVDLAGVHPDGPHTLTLQATDAAGNPGQTSRIIYVDNTSPPAPVDPSVVGGDDWRASNSFSVQWQNPAGDGGAPVAGVEYQLCPSSGAGPCVRGHRDGNAISKIENLELPSAGDWTMTLWLRDVAGNQQQASAGTVHLRWDETAPDLSFEPLSPADPTLLAVRVGDEPAGVSRAQIDIRRRGTKTWKALPTTVDAGRFTARLVDEGLRDGTYELLAYAADAAGNERTTGALADGKEATLKLPIRLRTTLRAGKSVKRGHRTALRERVHLGYGHAARLRGRLTTPDGNPIQDAVVSVTSRARQTGAQDRPIATVKTTRRGTFSFRARAGVSRTLRVRYEGTPTVRSATRRIALLVAARSSMHVDRHHVVNGESVHFAGRLRGGSIPAPGKLVELQVKTRGHWRTFATTNTTKRGGWRYEYRFDGTRGLQRYAFRARIPREATYPYETGSSAAVSVHVRGL